MNATPATATSSPISVMERLDSSQSPENFCASPSTSQSLHHHHNSSPKKIHRKDLFTIGSSMHATPPRRNSVYHSPSKSERKLFTNTSYRSPSKENRSKPSHHTESSMESPLRQNSSDAFDSPRQSNRHLHASPGGQHKSTVSTRRKSSSRNIVKGNNNSIQLALMKQAGKGPAIRFGPYCQPVPSKHEIAKLAVDKLERYLDIRHAWKEDRKHKKQKQSVVTQDMVLRAATFCSFEVEATIQLLRRMEPHVCKVTMQILQNDFQRRTVVPVPFLRTREASDVIYFNPSRIKPTKYDKDILKSLLIYTMNAVYERYGDPRRPMAMLINLTDWKMAKHFALDHWLQIIDIMQGEIVPMCFSQVLLVNPPPDFDRAWKLIRFMCKSGFERRFQYVPEYDLNCHLEEGFQEFLPTEFASGLTAIEHLIHDFVVYRKALESLVGAVDTDSTLTLSPPRRRVNKKSKPIIEAPRLDETPRVQNKRPVINRHASMPRLSLEPIGSTRVTDSVEENKVLVLKAEPLPVQESPNIPVATPKSNRKTLVVSGLDNPAPSRSKRPSHRVTSPRRLLIRMASVPGLLLSSLNKSSRKLMATKGKDEPTKEANTERDSGVCKLEVCESSQQDVALEVPVSPVQNPVSPTHESTADAPVCKSAASHIITPFRWRSCLGNSPQTPGRIQRQKPSIPVFNALCLDTKAETHQRERPTLTRTYSNTDGLPTRPTLSRAYSNIDVLSVSQRNLMRRMSSTIHEADLDSAPERVSDPTSTKAAIASTLLPRSKRLSRRDLMRRSVSSSSIDV